MAGSGAGVKDKNVEPEMESTPIFENLGARRRSGSLAFGSGSAQKIRNPFEKVVNKKGFFSNVNIIFKDNFA